MWMPPGGRSGGPPAMPQQQRPIAPVWQPPPAPFRPPPQPQTGLAVASLVLGLVSITVGWCYVGMLTSPVAIIMGIIALVQIKNNPTQYGGKPLAITGIVTGILYAVVLVLIIMLWGLGLFLGNLR